MTKKLYNLMDWAGIEAIVYEEHTSPGELLGPHKAAGGILIQVFIPDAGKVSVKNTVTGKSYKMDEVDEAGYFAALVPEKKVFPYILCVTAKDGGKSEITDPYQYEDLIEANALKRFMNGIHETVYERMGAHPVTVRGVGTAAEVSWDKNEAAEGETAGVHFAVWAPNAMDVSVVGDFNDWDGRAHQMNKIGNTGVFSLFIPGVKTGEIYKYKIKQNPVTTILKADPYGFASEVRPANASVVTNLSGYAWEDAEWLKSRKEADYSRMPVSIYEMHLGSWKKPAVEGEPKGAEEFYNYRELAPLVADYVKKMGYTHIELMPVMEHPLDESWGYQVTGYYAVTSRYGSPEDFMYFMDYLHQKKIGVILDWVPAHFPKDAHGLAKFDGTCLYEHFDPRLGEHPHWGTLIYNYGRPEVANFLLANAMFWVEKYHADGIRMDAVASMLYLDYGKNDGEWIANIYGGKENLEAVEFLKNLNKMLAKRKDGVMVIAEESTAWPKVSAPVSEGGLGFSFKWNMGWMNDFTGYMQTDPLYRKGRHGALTFSMVYAYSEQFILVFSHDEVVHEKGSMLRKMPGNREQQFASLRVAYGFMMAHPGKKLLFMGQEFAQDTEWNEKESLPWGLLENEGHRQMQDYVRALNRLYRKQPALYEMDYDTEGFAWMSALDADHSIITFVRSDEKKEKELLVVCNFTPVVYENFCIGVPYKGKYKEIFNSDAEEFGGDGNLNRRVKQSREVEWDGRENSINITVPPLGISVFTCTRSEQQRRMS